MRRILDQVSGRNTSSPYARLSPQIFRHWALKLHTVTTMANEGGEQPRPIYDGNRSILLVLTTIYMLWFIGQLGFVLVPKSVAHGFHIIGALVFLLTCAWNFFHTPSHGEWYRKAHRVSGWTAMISGVLVFITGIVIIVLGISSLGEAGIAVFCTTGTMQMCLQALAVYMIRFRKSTRGHRIALTIMFYNSLLLPGVNRFPQMVGFDGGLAWTFGSMPIGFIFAFVAIWGQEKTIRDREKIKTLEGNGETT